MEILIACLAGLAVGIMVRFMFPYGKSVNIVSGDIGAAVAGSVVAAVIFTLGATGPDSGPLWITAAVSVGLVLVLLAIFKILQRIFNIRTR